MVGRFRDIGVRTVVENIGGFLSDMDRYNNAISRAESRTAKFGERATRAGVGIAALGAPLAAIGVLSVRTFAQFEQSMARVGAVSGATEEELSRLTDTAKEMGRTTVFTARQSAEALAFMAQAGLSVEEQIGALPSTLNLAAAAQIDLASSADIVTNVMSGFGLEVEDVSRATDVLVTGFTSANTNLIQLGQAFKFAGPVAKAAGLEFEETAAALSLMGKAGIQASMAGTGLRGAITRLLNPSGEAQRVIERLGLTVLDSAGRIVPLVDIITQLEDSGLTAGDAMQIFGQRAGPAMLALLGEGSGALRQLTEEMQVSAGVAEEIAAKSIDTLQGSLTLLTSQAESTQIALGQNLAPVIRSLAFAAGPFLQTLAEWISKNPALTLTIVAISAALVVFGTALAAAGFIIPAAVSGFALLTVAVGFLTGGFIGLNIAMGPITLIILGISAVLVAGLVIWRNWARIIDFVRDRVNQLIRVVNRLIELAFRLNPLLAGISFVASRFGVNATPQLPMLAHGGSVMQAGAAIVGERGPEVVSLPAGAVVSPTSQSTNISVNANYTSPQTPQSLRLDLEAIAMAAGI